MMPKLDGQEALNRIRAIENKRRIPQHKAVKVIVTSVLEDSANIIRAFREYLVDAYLVKPIEQEKLKKELERLGFIQKG